MANEETIIIFRNFFHQTYEAIVYWSISDDVVYQQSGVVGATLDKRRPDLRDELGYIAPPNRKLPPVPGSNYNTCDRIKRGTVISKWQTIFFIQQSFHAHMLL